MSPFSECSLPQGGRAVLLSIKPRYSELIVTGTKRVEFRRTWAIEPVRWVALYSSSPAQQIVGIVEVDSVVVASPVTLWQLNATLGGGLTRAELRSYFEGKREGYALLLGQTWIPPSPIEPSKIVPAFRAPQSFRYLTESEMKQLTRRIKR